MTTITLSGWSEFQTKLKNMPDTLIKEIDGETMDASLEWEQLAKQAAPVNFGALRAGITSRKLAPMTYEVTSAKLYSAYVEWGTGTRVQVPAGLQTYALQFKGTMQTIGRYPHPFFFIQMPIVEKNLMTNIQNNILNKEH